MKAEIWVYDDGGKPKITEKETLNAAFKVAGVDDLKSFLKKEWSYIHITEKFFEVATTFDSKAVKNIRAILDTSDHDQQDYLLKTLSGDKVVTLEYLSADALYDALSDKTYNKRTEKITIKGKEYSLLNFEKDKTESDWIHYAVADSNNRIWGVTVNEITGEVSEMIPLRKSSVVN